MVAPAQVSAIVEARTLWLNGKLREFNTTYRGLRRDPIVGTIAPLPWQAYQLGIVARNLLSANRRVTEILQSSETTMRDYAGREDLTRLNNARANAVAKQDEAEVAWNHLRSSIIGTPEWESAGRANIETIRQNVTSSATHAAESVSEAASSAVAAAGKAGQAVSHAVTTPYDDPSAAKEARIAAEAANGGILGTLMSPVGALVAGGAVLGFLIWKDR